MLQLTSRSRKARRPSTNTAAVSCTRWPQQRPSTARSRSRLPRCLRRLCAAVLAACSRPTCAFASTRPISSPTRANVTEVPLDGVVAMTAARLGIHGDPGDRFTVATALIHCATLMTKDATLGALESLATVDPATSRAFLLVAPGPTFGCTDVAPHPLVAQDYLQWFEVEVGCPGERGRARANATPRSARENQAYQARMGPSSRAHGGHERRPDVFDVGVTVYMNNGRTRRATHRLSFSNQRCRLPPGCRRA